MNLPLVSVVMGVHNGGRYLEGSLDSALAQDDVGLELVIVDDGSTDETASVLAGYAQRDPRVRVISQANAGLTRALVRGCAAARGEFIARQDADDLSLPGRFHAQAAALAANPELALVSCWAECIGPEDELLYTIAPELTDAEATRELLAGTHGPIHGTVMFRRTYYERVGGYRPAFYYAQDSDLWRRLAQHGGQGFVRRVLYRLRVHSASIGASRAAVQQEFDRLARAACEVRLAGGDDGPFIAEAERLTANLPRREARSRSVAYFVGQCLIARRDPRARAYLWDAFRDRPLEARVWAALVRSLLIR
jgi:glycosyltransferase involved in cell wall biosynthesis